MIYTFVHQIYFKLFTIDDENENHTDNKGHGHSHDNIAVPTGAGIQVIFAKDDFFYGKTKVKEFLMKNKNNKS